MLRKLAWDGWSLHEIYWACLEALINLPVTQRWEKARRRREVEILGEVKPTPLSFTNFPLSFSCSCRCNHSHFAGELTLPLSHSKGSHENFNGQAVYLVPLPSIWSPSTSIYIWEWKHFSLFAVEEAEHFVSVEKVSKCVHLSHLVHCHCWDGMMSAFSNAKQC